MGIVVEAMEAIFKTKADTSGLEKYTKAEQKAEKETMDTTRAMEKQEKKTKLLGQGIGKLAGYMAGVMTLGYAMNLTANADATGKFADSLGVSIEKVQEFEFAIQRQGGSISEFRSGFEKLNKALAEYRLGTGRSVKLFKDLGYDLSNIGNAEELFNFLNKQIQTMDTADQVNLTEKLGLGKGFLKLLQTGSKDIRQLRREAEKYGVISDKQFRLSADFEDKMTNLGYVLKKISYDILEDFLPPLIKFFGILGDGLVYVKDHIKFFEIFGAGLLTVIARTVLFSTAMTGLAKALGIVELLLAPFTAVGLAIAGVITGVALLGEDIYNFATGGISVIGKLAEKFEFFNRIVQGVKNTVSSAFDYIKPLFSWGGVPTAPQGGSTTNNNTSSNNTSNNNNSININNMNFGLGQNAPSVLKGLAALQLANTGGRR